MASSLCVFAAMSGGGAAGRPGSGGAVPGRLATGQQGGSKGKRAVSQPLAASAATETPTPAVVAPAPPGRPAVVDAPRRRGGRGAGSGHAAWKSVRQERWEGALEVEGELPLWLVGTTSFAMHACALSLICLLFVFGKV